MTTTPSPTDIATGPYRVEQFPADVITRHYIKGGGIQVGPVPQNDATLWAWRLNEAWGLGFAAGRAAHARDVGELVRAARASIENESCYCDDRILVREGETCTTCRLLDALIPFKEQRP